MEIRARTPVKILKGKDAGLVGEVVKLTDTGAIVQIDGCVDDQPINVKTAFKLENLEAVHHA
jgi:ribosomal protein L24